jgi:O-antigen/teichoic acid export membrane protein
MDSPHTHLARGFNWLGGATVIAKIIDFSTILAVLMFLTKEQVGVASLVVSIAMVVEAFDGLGTAEALVQARSVSRLQLDSLFWFVIGAAGPCWPRPGSRRSMASPGCRPISSRRRSSSLWSGRR